MPHVDPRRRGPAEIALWGITVEGAIVGNVAGGVIATSTIRAAAGRLVKTKTGSIYRLGEPSVFHATRTASAFGTTLAPVHIWLEFASRVQSGGL